MFSLANEPSWWPRFTDKIVLSEAGCWEWSGYVMPNGYGQFRLNGSAVLAHRAAYLAAHGSLPEGLDLDHLCRNRRCVRPAHLEAVSRRENLRRGEGHGSETHCPQGHPYDDENTYRAERGDRQCRRCGRERQRKVLSETA